jgi:hypothetical protein
MCTYQTKRIVIDGSAKTPSGWTHVTNASIYFDHPNHFGHGHALLVDILCPENGPSARVAFELHPESARKLAEAILQTLESTPRELFMEYGP